MTDQPQTQALAVLGGTDKQGNPEPVREVRFEPGDVVALVGPTGSGKSRFLEDIEWLTQGDSPTGRRVTAPTQAEAAGPGAAQPFAARLSQNMMYHLDMPVREFLETCAEAGDCEAGAVDRVLRWADRMSGEPFAPDAALCALSGGQARALMIAETALLSDCRVVLVDEIENAGIDRFEALEFLVAAETIAVVATHDPVLILQAASRITFANGAMVSVMQTSEAERGLLEELRRSQDYYAGLRNRLRAGERLGG